MRTAPDFVTATVRSADDIASDVRLICLVPDAGHRPAAPGSHVDVEIAIGGVVRQRSYSVVDDRDGGWSIAVRRLDQGRGGSTAMARLQAGDTLRITRPSSHFGLSPSSPEYLLIAGGIGITPLLGMARILAPRARVRLLYAGRSRASMPFLDMLGSLLGERLGVFAADEGQRIDLAAAFASLHPDGEAYLCGPAAMLEAARDAWRQAGRHLALLRFETFGSGGAHEPEPFRVHVRDHGVTVDVPRDSSLLEALAAHGIEVAHDCLRGECGLCAVDVIGPARIDHRDVFLSEQQRAEGHCLCACVSRGLGELTIDTGFRASLAKSSSVRIPNDAIPA